MIYAACMEQLKTNDKATVSHIVKARKSSSRKNQSQFVSDLIAASDASQYILNVGTLAPEKNLNTLVRAWEALNLKHKRDLKLVIVAEGERLLSELKEYMQPHIDQGNLIYLSKVSDADKSFLYANAELFVSPAYSDNTSTHLLSAMHYSCPIIASDIPTHRWVMADAAWYCDPRSENSLMESMAKLLYKDHADSLRESLIAKGLDRAKLFSHDKSAKQWISVFEQMKVASV